MSHAEEKDRSKETVENESPVEQGENQEPLEENTATQPDEKTLHQNEVAELKDKYLRLYSEFDNFRKRTSKEKSDLLKSAGEEVILSMLPVLDDFERAKKAFGNADETDPVKQGVELIYHKLFKTLEAKGLHPMKSIGQPFNPELHEAITQSAAPSEDLKGKIIDELEKGYYLNDKVIRFAKVIIGA